MDGGKVLAAQASETDDAPLSRRWVWLALVIVVIAAVSVLAWATFVGWDTTVRVPDNDGLCRLSVNADGRLLSVVPRHVGNTIEYPSLWGDRVRVHHQLFHENTYRFLAADGSTIPLRPGQQVACAGPP